jgi:hypothetical protein
MHRLSQDGLSRTTPPSSLCHLDWRLLGAMISRKPGGEDEKCAAVDGDRLLTIRRPSAKSSSPSRTQLTMLATDALSLVPRPFCKALMVGWKGDACYIYKTCTLVPSALPISHLSSSRLTVRRTLNSPPHIYLATPAHHGR